MRRKRRSPPAIANKALWGASRTSIAAAVRCGCVAAGTPSAALLCCTAAKHAGWGTGACCAKGFHLVKPSVEQQHIVTVGAAY